MSGSAWAQGATLDTIPMTVLLNTKPLPMSP